MGTWRYQDGMTGKREPERLQGGELGWTSQFYILPPKRERAGVGGLVRADFLSWVLPFPPGLGEPRRGLWDLFGSKAFSGLRLGFRGQFLASPLTEQIPYKQTSFSCLALGLLFPSGPPHGTAPSGPAPSPFPSTGSQPALQGPQ